MTLDEIMKLLTQLKQLHDQLDKLQGTQPKPAEVPQQPSSGSPILDLITRLLAGQTAALEALTKHTAAAVADTETLAKGYRKL